jgi:hypothetical protein
MDQQALLASTDITEAPRYATTVITTIRAIHTCTSPPAAANGTADVSGSTHILNSKPVTPRGRHVQRGSPRGAVKGGAITDNTYSTSNNRQG